MNPTGFSFCIFLAVSISSSHQETPADGTKPPSGASVDVLLIHAELDFISKRYENALENWQKISLEKTDLPEEHQQLFENTIFQFVEPRRAGLKLIQSKEASFTTEPQKALIKELQTKIHTEIHEACTKAVAVLDQLKTASKPEDKVKYFRILGDVNRIMAEKDKDAALKEASATAYETAKGNSPSISAQLDIANGLAALKMDIDNQPKEALQILNEVLSKPELQPENTASLSEEDKKKLNEKVTLIHERKTTYEAAAQKAT